MSEEHSAWFTVVSDARSDPMLHRYETFHYGVEITAACGRTWRGSGHVVQSFYDNQVPEDRRCPGCAATLESRPD